MNVQQNFNARNKMFQINDYSNIKIGKNITANRLTVVNNQAKPKPNLFQTQSKRLIFDQFLKVLFKMQTAKIISLNVNVPFYDEK